MIRCLARRGDKFSRGKRRGGVECGNKHEKQGQKKKLVEDGFGGIISVWKDLNCFTIQQDIESIKSCLLWILPSATTLVKAKIYQQQDIHGHQRMNPTDSEQPHDFPFSTTSGCKISWIYSRLCGVQLTVTIYGISQYKIWMKMKKCILYSYTEVCWYIIHTLILQYFIPKNMAKLDFWGTADLEWYIKKRYPTQSNPKNNCHNVSKGVY